MRRTKPPVGWEKVRNCFPVPNELLDFDLPAGAVAVYLYLLRHANRKTNRCHPSEATIAKKLHLSRNTVAKQVRLLEERGLIVTEHTSIIMRDGRKQNGSLLYTILPIQFSIDLFYQRQMDAVDSAAQRSLGTATRTVRVSVPKALCFFQCSFDPYKNNKVHPSWPLRAQRFRTAQNGPRVVIAPPSKAPRVSPCEPLCARLGDGVACIPAAAP